MQLTRRNINSVYTRERIDELKLEIIQEIKKEIRRKKWNQQEAARAMETSRSCIHLIETLKIEQLTVSQLFKYLARLEPKFRILISIV
jgi:predicted XRE-type DNA-binding protein